MLVKGKQQDGPYKINQKAVEFPKQNNVHEVLHKILEKVQCKGGLRQIRGGQRGWTLQKK